MSWPITRAVSALLCWSISAGFVLAQSADRPAIDLAEALRRTAADNPELVAHGYEIAAAEGRLLQSTLAPNPELGVTVEDALGTDRYRGLHSAEMSITLGWTLERGVRERIVDAARAGVSMRATDVEIARLDVAAETARRFLLCLAFQERLLWAEQSVGLAEATVEAVRTRVAAGRTPAAELARAEADLVRAELVEEDFEHELLSAYHRLSAQWGDTRPDFASTRGDVERLPAVEPFETLLARVTENPDLARFMSERRLREAELRLAEARGRPSWHTYVGLRRYEATDDVALVGGIEIPLPLSDRNQGRAAETRARIAETEASAEAARVRIETELFVLYQAFRHDVQLAARLNEDVIPHVERALADTRQAYEAGRYSYSEWRAVQTELLEAERQLLEAYVDAHRIAIEIERLTGTPIAPVTAQ